MQSFHRNLLPTLSASPTIFAAAVDQWNDALAQQGKDLRAQLAFGHGVNGAVNAFVADALGRLHAGQCAADLLGRQALLEASKDVLPQGISEYQFGCCAGLGSKLARSLVSLLAPVAVDAPGARSCGRA